MSKKRLKDIAVEKNERVDNPSQSSYNVFVGLEHYDSGEATIRRFGSTEMLESTMKVFHAGDILVARRNVYLRRAAFVDIDGLTSGDSIVLHIENETYRRIIPFVLNTDDFWNYANQHADGSMSKRLSPKLLMEYEFFLPDDGIDQLSDILWAMERVKNAYRELILRTDDLVKSQFVEMFGDLKTNDKNWVTKPLRELCEITRGGSPRPISDYLGGTIPWIKIGDATDGDNIYINSTKEHIIEAGVKKSRYVKAGSLVFANCGVSLGFCRIISIDGCIHDGWLALQNIDESIDKVFLLMTINQQTEYFRSIAPGSTQPKLNTEIMGNYRQIIPPMQLQKQYIDFINQTDKSKFAAQQTLKELTAVQKALMKKYLNDSNGE